MYSLCALLGGYQDLERRLSGPPYPPLVALDSGYGMVPLSESLLREVERSTSSAGAAPSAASVVPGTFEFLTPTMEQWICRLSEGTAIAYAETEYFAGEGFERAAVFREGALALGPLDGAGAINRVLRFLGFTAEPGREEFDAIGLGRHRSLDEWLSEAERAGKETRDRDAGGNRALNQNV